MSNNPAQTLVLRDRLRQVAEEQAVGGHFEGESKRERKVGHEREVVVDIFKRLANPHALIGTVQGTYFLRVSLRCPIDTKYITRFEIDIDRYTTERALLEQVFIGGGAIAEAQNENRGARWDCGYVAKQAVEAGKELLKEING